ncbi:putative polyketide hydroxylase [Panicum miliaceum]|uniref:Polyketide hydroxylase n=1 Tax=Panicum miliaceum TaxID=4540 RepID=A0A3L6SSI2_PANMI|nr:putative polyketide hydroxylase [Panicum miliaceum]
MPSIAGGARGRLFAAHRGAIWWLRRRQQRPFSSLVGGGRQGDAPHLPVLIVGAGPVGLVLSFLLTKFGIKCAVIEKNVEFTRHPRAHFINNRTMEIPFYPPQQMLEEFSSKVCEQIIVKLVGWEPADVQVVDIKPWAMHAEVAEKYISCNNRVVLVGDAAHRFPPAGGFGMNTGVQDAHNLAWKLGLMLNGVASPSMLQTYESERRPVRPFSQAFYSSNVAIFNTELSVENFKAAMSIPASLGLDPTVANSDAKRASREYIPSAKVGSRLPHMLVRALPASSEGVFSTLDLVSVDKLEFVLIIAPLKESYEIARATLKVADEFKLSVKVCVMWPQGSADVEVEESRSELAPWTNYVDVEEVPRVTGNSWWEMCRISRKNVILVRPDEHIAWRTEWDMVRDADSEVRGVFSRILCLNCHQV